MDEINPINSTTAEMPVDTAPPEVDAFLAQYAQSPVVSSDVAPTEEPPEVDAFLADLKEEKYGTLGHQAKALASGIGEGLAGPISTAIETHIIGRDPEEMRMEREVNPIAHGGGQALGLGASLFTGVGEGALLAKAGTLAKEAAGLSKLGQEAKWAAKVGAEALDQSVQMGLLSGSDDISKMMINDPDTTVESALAHAGMAAALGGVTGVAFGAVSPLWKATGLGEKSSRFVQDFKDEMKFLHENPNPITTAVKELEDLHGSTQVLKESLYKTGLKGDLIKEMIPEVSEAASNKINGALQTISDDLSKTIKEASENLKSGSASRNLTQDLVDFQKKVTTPGIDYLGQREAVNDLRATLHEYTNWQKLGTTEGTMTAQYARDLNSKIIPLLEDQNIWGKAGKVQEVFNKAFHEFSNSKAEKDFLKTFTNEVGGVRSINPAKIDTFVKQAGSPKAEIKNEILENYIKEHEKFANKINGIVGEFGRESLVPPPSIGMLNKLLGEKTAGAEVAQKLVNKISDNVLGKAAGISVGSLAGGAFGHPFIGAVLGEHLLGNTMGSVLNGLTKNVLESATAGTAFKSAVDFANAAAKGQKALSKAVGNVLKPGAMVLGVNMLPDVSSRTKLDKALDNINKNPELLLQNSDSKIGHYMPNHQTALSASQTRAVQYLQSLKPHDHILGPLDKSVPPQPIEIARYNRALDIAQQPAIVLQHIKDGKLMASDIADLHAMYPALYKDMSSKLTAEIAARKADDEPVPYKTRMGISLFLGQPLDVSMQPASIMAAQPMPKQAQPAPQPQGKTRKGTTSLGKTNQSYQTPGQAAESDRGDRG